MNTINGAVATRDELAAAVVVRPRNYRWDVVTEDGVVAVRDTFASACYRAQVAVEDLQAADVENFGAANPDRRVLVVTPDSDGSDLVTLDGELMMQAIRAKW